MSRRPKFQSQIENQLKTIKCIIWPVFFCKIIVVKLMYLESHTHFRKKTKSNFKGRHFSPWYDREGLFNPSISTVSGYLPVRGLESRKTWPLDVYVRSGAWELSLPRSFCYKPVELIRCLIITIIFHEVILIKFCNTARQGFFV